MAENAENTDNTDNLDGLHREHNGAHLGGDASKRRYAKNEQALNIKKTPPDTCVVAESKIFCSLQLSAQAESLDDRTIARDVAVVQIVEQGTAFSYQLGQ